MAYGQNASQRIRKLVVGTRGFIIRNRVYAEGPWKADVHAVVQCVQGRYFGGILTLAESQAYEGDQQGESSGM